MRKLQANHVLLIDFYQRIKKFETTTKYLNLHDTRSKISEFSNVSKANIELLSGQLKELERQIEENSEVL